MNDIQKMTLKELKKERNRLRKELRKQVKSNYRIMLFLTDRQIKPMIDLSDSLEEVERRIGMYGNKH